MRSLFALLLAPTAAACPGSPVSMHASASLTVTFSQDCATVRAEILARLQGTRGWADPHNRGTYTLLPAAAAEATLNVQRRTGDNRYTDLMDFSFADAGAAHCSVVACSESQVTSYLDMSTNYCSLKNLYCGSADGCPWVLTDLGYTESRPDMGAGAAHNFGKCLAVPVTLSPAAPPPAPRGCGAGMFDSGGGCTPCTACAPGESVRAACSARADALCAARSISPDMTAWGTRSACRTHVNFIGTGADICMEIAAEGGAPSECRDTRDPPYYSCDPLPPPVMPAPTPACWSGAYTAARCCAGGGDATCWSGRYTFSACCGGAAADGH